MSENTRNEVEIDLDKYNEMLLKLDEANDKVEELEKLAKDLKTAARAATPKEDFVMSDLFMDDNKINEKSIIGFMSFFMMVAFGIADLISGWSGSGFSITDTIYVSFVVVTLGCFGISEAGKAFSKQ